MDSTSRGGDSSELPRRREGMKGAAYGAGGALLGVGFMAGTAVATNALLQAHGALAAGTYVGPSTRSACFASALERLRQSLEEVQGSPWCFITSAILPATCSTKSEMIP